MAPKNRDFYVAETPGRDFTWFSFWAPAMTMSARSKTEPTPSYSASHSRTRVKAPPVVKKPAATTAKKAPAAPARRPVEAVVTPAVTKPKIKKHKGKAAGVSSKKAGPWSDWYVSDDRKYFWRARQTPNETWDYQYTPGYEQPPVITSRSPSPTEPSIDSAPAAHAQSRTPKSSWPTIVTTSTGQPTEAISATSGRALSKLTEEQSEPQARPRIGPFSAAMAPLILTVNDPHARSTNKKRSPPAMPRTMSLFSLPGRSRPRSSKARSDNKSTAASTMNISKQQKRIKTAAARNSASVVKTKSVKSLRQIPGDRRSGKSTSQSGRRSRYEDSSLALLWLGGAHTPHMLPHHNGHGRTLVGGPPDSSTAATNNMNNNNNNNNNNNTTMVVTPPSPAQATGTTGASASTNTKFKSAQAKKLDHRIKSEKELKIDPRKRVRTWLKDVQPDLKLIQLDAQGFPIWL